MFETLQFVFAIGASDITDLLANTLGGILGIALFLAFQKLFRKNCISVINIVGGIIEATAFLLLGLLNLVN